MASPLLIRDGGGGGGEHQKNQDQISPIGSDSGFNKIADWITLAVRLKRNGHYCTFLTHIPTISYSIDSSEKGTVQFRLSE